MRAADQSDRVIFMPVQKVPDALIVTLRDTVAALVRRNGPDLSARQLGVFLICYLEPELQTVRGLAAKLRVARPAITRALDRLAEVDLVRRKPDPLDRRSILVKQTATGIAFMRDLRHIMAVASSPAPDSAGLGSIGPLHAPIRQLSSSIARRA
jgi:DNA-binding MarR family transcriptional regulator